MNNLIITAADAGAGGVSLVFIAGLCFIVLGMGLLAAAFFMHRKFLAEAAAEQEMSLDSQPDMFAPSPAAKLSIFADSQLGNRQIQQDYCTYAANLSPEQLRMGTLGIVCDGMGGMEGGEMASQLCAGTMYNGFYQLGEVDDICTALKELVMAADDEVSRLKGADGRKLNCGTTVVAAVVRGGRAYWVSCGDSRIYHIHNGTARQITRDHNLKLKLMEAAAAGMMSMEEAQTHPQREALISYVGKGGDLIIDTGIIDFRPDSGDMLLLCSDGVYKVLSQLDVLNIALDCADEPSRVAATLARTAIATGNVKHDNTTVLAFCYT